MVLCFEVFLNGQLEGSFFSRVNSGSVTYHPSDLGQTSDLIAHFPICKMGVLLAPTSKLGKSEKGA